MVMSMSPAISFDPLKPSSKTRKISEQHADAAGATRSGGIAALAEITKSRTQLGCLCSADFNEGIRERNCGFVGSVLTSKKGARE
ncbi:hypothetical protein Tco_0032582 [Tanacetum coccineum]